MTVYKQFKTVSWKLIFVWTVKEIKLQNFKVVYQHKCVKLIVKFIFTSCVQSDANYMRNKSQLTFLLKKLAICTLIQIITA